MDTRAIAATFAMACVLAFVAFAAHGRLAGTGERPGCASMIAFVIGWLAVLLALITGLFMFSIRGT